MQYSISPSYISVVRYAVESNIARDRIHSSNDLQKKQNIFKTQCSFLLTDFKMSPYFADLPVSDEGRRGRGRAEQRRVRAGRAGHARRARHAGALPGDAAGPLQPRAARGEPKGHRPGDCHM